MRIAIAQAWLSPTNSIIRRTSLFCSLGEPILKIFSGSAIVRSIVIRGLSEANGS